MLNAMMACTANSSFMLVGGIQLFFGAVPGWDWDMFFLAVLMYLGFGEIQYDTF